ncbi:MAG: phage tail tip fiber protein [Cellvibrionaceae bacterium]
MKTGLPDVPHSVDPILRNYLQKVKELLEVGEGDRGDPLDKKLTKRELVGLELAKVVARNQRNVVLKPTVPQSGAAGSGSDSPPETVNPPPPENLVVSPGLSHIHVEFDNPDEQYQWHSHSIVLRATEDNVSNAVQVHQTTGFIYGDLNVQRYDGDGNRITYYYWVKHVSQTDHEGDVNASSGTSGQVSDDPSDVLKLLEGKISSGQLDADEIFDVDTFAIRSSGNLSLSFAVHDGKVLMDSASIHNLTVTSAQIDDLSATKLTGMTSSFVLGKLGTGSITNAYIGSFIQSDNFIANAVGWKINKNGSFECHSGYFRGDIYSANAYVRGDVEATSIKADAANIVKTLHLQEQAVTFKATSYDSAEYSHSYGRTSTTGWKTLDSYNVTVTGAPVEFEVDIDLFPLVTEPYADKMNYRLEIQLLINGSVVRRATMPAFQGGDTDNGYSGFDAGDRYSHFTAKSFAAGATPGAGSRPFLIRARMVKASGDTASCSIYWRYAYMRVLETKK